LGWVALYTADSESAAAHFEASLDISRSLGDLETVAMSLLMLGNIAMRQDRLDEAKAHLRESLEIQRLEGSSRSIANLFESLAAVAIAEGQSDRALRLGGAAEGLRKRIEVVSASPLHREISHRLESVRRGRGAQKEWLAGATMSRQGAVAYALDEVDVGS